MSLPAVADPALRRPQAFRVRQLLKWVVIVGFGLLTLWLVYERWGIRVTLQAELLLRQRACLQFQESPERVVYEGNPSRAGTLSQQPGYKPLRARHDRGLFDSGSDAILAASSTRAKESLSAMDEVQVRIARYEELHHPRPPVARAVWGLFGPSVDATIPVFLHERSVQGVRRLVRLQAEWSRGSATLNLSADVSAPAGWRTLPRVFSTKLVDPQGSPADKGIGPDSTSGWLRLYAGQPDPDDASAFTFRFETTEGSGTIAGKLRADDTIEIRLASWRGIPGATPPSGPSLEQPTPDPSDDAASGHP